MENSRISAYQLFTLLVIFIIGTTVIFPLGADAKQAAWISILVGMIGGFPLLIMYNYLNKQFPNMVLTEYCKKIFGTYIGTIIGILYILYFMYAAARNVRDAMELVPLFLHGTPVLVIGILIMLPMLYALYLGIEVIGRTSEIFFVYIGLTGFLMVILVFISGIVKVENILPVLEPGWKTIIGTTIGETWMAPFGEVICFTMIFSYLNKPKLQLKVGFLGVLCGGLALSFIHLLTIAVLGIDSRNNSLAPLLKMVQKIDIADVIQRLDAIFMIWLIVNNFFKITIFMYAAVIGGATILKVSKNLLIIPFGLIVFITATLFTGNYIEHMAQSHIVLKYVYPVFAAFIPLLLCSICFLRQKINT